MIKSVTITKLCNKHERITVNGQLPSPTIHVHNGRYEKALQLFEQMQNEGESHNKFTFTSVLKACAGLTDLERGKEI